MATHMFMKVDGIEGESQNEKHKNWIEIVSYVHNIAQPTTGSASTSGARTAERADHGDFVVEKAIDKATPKLALHCCNGRHIKEVTLELCRDTGDQQKYMEYKLNDVIIKSVTPNHAKNESDPLPTEELALSYGKIQWTYTETDHRTGKAKGDITAQWDAIANTGG